MALDNFSDFGWYGCLSALVLSSLWLSAMVPARPTSSGEESCDSSERTFWVNAWKLTGPVAFVISLFLLVVKPGSGGRGLLACLIFGLLLPSISLWAESLARKNRLSAVSSLSGEFSLGLFLFVLGAIGHFYGFRAYSLLFALALGISLGGLWIGMLKRWSPAGGGEGISSLVRLVETQTLFHLALLSSLALAWYHFAQKSGGASTPIFLGLIILLGRILVLFFFRAQKEGRGVTTWPLVLYFVIAASLAAVLNFRQSLSAGYIYPFVFGLLTGVLILAVIREGGTEDRLSGTLGIFLFCGLVWVSFRMSLGYGLSLGFLGLLSLPGVIDFKEEKSRVRGLILIGLAGLLLVGWRVFLQETNLVTFGVDLAAGYGFIGLLAGVILPVFVVAGGFFEKPPQTKGFSRAVGSYAAILFMSLLALLSIWIFLGSSGLAASFLGLVLSSLFCVFYFISTGREEGLYRSDFSLLWTALPFAGCLMAGLSDRLATLTRVHKVWLLVLILGIFLFLELTGRKKEES
ncbi:MAG: hypothetical protein V2A78_02350 [bacterium]